MKIIIKKKEMHHTSDASKLLGETIDYLKKIRFEKYRKLVF
jgi:hypothetical protein